MQKYVNSKNRSSNNCVRNIKMYSLQILLILVEIITIDIDTGHSPPISKKPYSMP